MKAPNFTKYQAKSFLILATAILLLVITSCSKGDDVDDENKISEEEAAEAIISAVSAGNGGMLDESMEAISIFEGNDPSSSGKSSSAAKSLEYICGETYNSAYVFKKESGAITYNMNYSWAWALNCEQGQFPNSVSFDLDGIGSYSAPKASGSISDKANILIAYMLEEEPSAYLIQETLNRKGTFESHIKNKIGFSSTINLVTEDLKILEVNYNVVSGTVGATFKGTSSTGNTYNYGGTVEFTGNQTATLTMDSGNTYSFSW